MRILIAEDDSFERGAGLQAVPGSGLGLALVQALAVCWNARLEPSWEASGLTPMPVS